MYKTLSFKCNSYLNLSDECSVENSRKNLDLNHYLRYSPNNVPSVTLFPFCVSGRGESRLPGARCSCKASQLGPCSHLHWERGVGWPQHLLRHHHPVQKGILHHHEFVYMRHMLGIINMIGVVSFMMMSCCVLCDPGW